MFLLSFHHESMEGLILSEVGLVKFLELCTAVRLIFWASLRRESEAIQS